MTLIKVTDRLPEKGKDVLIFSTHSGFSVAKFTNRNLTYGYHQRALVYKRRPAVEQENNNPLGRVAGEAG